MARSSASCSSHCSRPRLVIQRSCVSEAKQSFEAYAFHPSLSNEVVAGKIVFEFRILRFEADGVRRDIRIDTLKVNAEDGEGGRVCFRDPADPEWLIYTFDWDILDHRSLASLTNVRAEIGDRLAQQELWRRIRLVLIFLGSFGFLAWSIAVASGLMVRSLAAHVPPEMEKQFGDDAFSELSSNVTLVQDSNLTAQVSAVIAPLIAALPTNGVPIQLHIVDDDEPNAFALPGGHLIVNTGLLREATRPEQVAGVLAHELAHEREHHAFRKIIAGAGPMLVCSIFLRGGGGTAGLLAGGSALLVNQSYSQEFETEADLKGFDYLVAAHIDPRGLAEMLQTFVADDKKRHEASDVPQAFSSHPATAKRIQRLNRKWDKLEPKPKFIELPKIDPLPDTAKRN